MLAGFPVLAQVSGLSPAAPGAEQRLPATETEAAPGTAPSSPPAAPPAPSSPAGSAASPGSPFGLSPDIFPGLLGGRPDRGTQEPPAEPGIYGAPTGTAPGIYETPTGAAPETVSPAEPATPTGTAPETTSPAEPAAPIEPQPGLAATPDLVPPIFAAPGFGFGNFPGYGFGNLTPGGALLPPNPAPPTGAFEPLATARLAPLQPGAVPVQANNPRAPPILIRSRATATAGYTDNSRNLPGGFSDALARLSGNTAISVDTVRLQGQLTGGLDYLRYARASEQTRLNADLLAYGFGTVVRDHLFVDARAAITQASQTGGLAFAGPELIQNSNQTQVLTTSLTPIARQSFGGYVDGELRYNYSMVRFQPGSLLGSANTTAPSTALPLTNLRDATRNEGTLNLATGRLFTVFASKVTLDAMEIDSQSAARTSQLRAYDNFAYQFNQKFTGLAQVGYENLDYPLQPAASFTGPSWSFGGRYAPFPGSYLVATYGRQDGFYGYNGALRYEITPRTIALASYQHNRASQQQQILNNLNSSVVDAYGNLVNQYSGVPTALVNPELGLTQAISRFDTARVGLQTRLDRDTFSLFGFYTRRLPLGTPIGTTALTTTAGQDTGIGANFTWSRSLTLRLNSNAGIGYATESASDQRTLTARLLMTYVLTERLTATLVYQFINVDSAVANGSYRRNQVEIGLSRSF